MNKKMLYAATITALLMCSIFAAIKIGTVHSVDLTNGMAMDPTEYVVNPPEGGADLTFQYKINITTTVVNVTAWEAKLLWDPAVLRATNVTWGTFMSGGDTTNSTQYAGGGQSLLLGQSFDEQVIKPAGSGWLANVTFTFVLPGATFVKFLEANVTDDSMVSYSLLGNSLGGRVTTTMPHPQFWWWTNDTAGATYWNSVDGAFETIPASVSAKAHGEGPIPSIPVNDGTRLLSAGTTVYFTGNFSYDTAVYLWNDTSGTYYKSGSAPYGIGTYMWDYGDGVVDVYTGANFTDGTSHMYSAYSQTGYIVNLTVWTGASKTGTYWSSTWRYQGPAPDDTVPMWRDVGIVDIWPSLIPFQEWNPYVNGTWGTDWWAPWWFDSTDYWLPNVNDAYWNYIVPAEAARYYSAYTGATVPAADKRLYPTYGAYKYGSYVKQAGYAGISTTDTDVGLTLRKFNATADYGINYLNGNWTYMYYDHDNSKAYNLNDSIVLMNSTARWWNGTTWIKRDPTFNSTYGDIAYNQAVPDGSAVLAISSFVRYYDTNSNLKYTAGEPIYYDYYPRGTVYGQWSSVKQAYAAIAAADLNNGGIGSGDLYTATYDYYGVPYPNLGLQGEGPGLNVLVTANNFGSVTETCTVNLYAIGFADKSNAAGNVTIRTSTAEQIGHWTGVIMTPHSGTGWNLACNWLPSKNAAYTLIATIESDQGSQAIDAGVGNSWAPSAAGDQNLANNWMALSTPVSNIADWVPYNPPASYHGGPALSLVPPAYTNAQYLCDQINVGTITATSGVLSFLLHNIGSHNLAWPYNPPTSVP